MNATKIEYLTHTWNPITMRCTPVSEGCRHCWHLGMADRLKTNPGISAARRDAYAGGRPRLNLNEIGAPSRLKNPGIIGVQFMGDLFHEAVTDDMRIDAFAAMQAAQHHFFIILTKRAENMKRFINGPLDYFDTYPAGTPLFPHVLIGVSVEDQRTADERIPVLLDTRFGHGHKVVSLEPMIEPVRFDSYPDWVIMGCESGSGARPMQREWAVDVARQCEVRDIPLFYKQGPGDGGYYGKMPTLNGREYRQYPAVMR